jgi:glucose 1-dehydrogenase
VLGVNVRGAFLCLHEAIKHFLDDGKTGAIVNVSSVHQIIPELRFLSYSVVRVACRT